MSVTETMKAITDCAKKLIEAPRYNVGDFVGIYGYETDVRIQDVRQEGYSYAYKVYLADEEEWIYDDDIAYKKDEKIEGLVEDENNHLTETVVDTVRESNDRYRIVIDPRFDIEVDEGEYYAVRRKKEYPKTYEECYKIMGVKLSDCYIQGYKSPFLEDLQELLICRDAYWKIAGEEMGLGKPWEPDITIGYFIPSIIYRSGFIQKVEVQYRNAILSFPTPEMRDAFYENFKEEIEICKELL